MRAADIALALHHAENARTQLGSRREDTVLARLLAVADAVEHITQGIGDRHLGISLPDRLRNTGDQAVIGQFPQHHAAELKLTMISAGPSGHRATVGATGAVRLARKPRMPQRFNARFG